ncbi:MAG: FtsW/RodA/SpoVE family cell cycle protein [Clostridiales bacterium]|nr:FtsW/RodA/SpoVE family cell cycle protein [Clostridiales bacterium]
MTADTGRDDSRRLALPGAVFLLSGFLLLALKDFYWLTFAMAALVPLVFYLASVALPRFIRADRLILCLVNFLCALGVLALYRMNPERGISQAVNYFFGLVGMVLCLMLVRYWHRVKWMVPLIALGALLLMALPVFFGTERNGAKAWVSLLGVSFQPSEIVKVALLLVLSSLLARRRMMPALLFSGGCLALLMLQKDLGTALLYYGITLLMVFAATSSVVLLALGAVGAAAGAVAGYGMFSHVRRRVAIWRNPWLDYQDSGYQIVQSLVAMANGGLWGTGLGLGNAGVIPEVETDFIFSALFNEFGVLFGICVIAVYLFIFLRGVGIALRSHSKFHTLLALGCSCLVAMQTFVIIGGNIKLIPLTGVTLPFISYGGTSLVSSLSIMGLLQGVANVNQQDILEDQLIAMVGEEGA